MTNLLLSDLNDMTPKIIQTILGAIRFSRPLPDKSLNVLSIVQKQVPQNVPKTMHDYMLIDWLSNEITTQYNQHRQTHQLPAIHRQCNYARVLTHLAEDFTEHSEHLQAWSMLYHRYVRVDIQLLTTDVQTVTLHSDRNLRRRQTLGYALLCHHLLSLEQATLERRSSNL
jgi:hypothetical protein